jgi:iron complex outermembrane recepter protein
MAEKHAYQFAVALCALIMAGSWQSVLAAPDSAAALAAEQPAPGDDTQALSEIVVTARKRVETLLDVPASLQVVSGSTISEMQIKTALDLSTLVPNFTQSTDGPFALTFLRGVGSGPNPSFEQAVGTFIDDIYVGRSEETRTPYYDVQSIDVLKGPQVVLYGNSTTAGAISIVTNTPSPVYSADLDVAYEFRNEENTVQGDVNLPISDKLRIRIAGYDDDINRGWITNYSQDFAPPAPYVVSHDPLEHDRAARIQVELLPTEQLTILLKYERADTKNIGGTLQIVDNLLQLPFIPKDNFSLTRYLGNPPPFPYDPQDVVKLTSNTVESTITYSLPTGTLVSTTGYNWYNFFADQEGDMTPLPIFEFGQLYNYEQSSEELRYSASFGSKIDLIVGGYYQHALLDLTGRTDVNAAALGAPFPPLSRFNYLDQNENDYAVFGDVTYHMLEKLKLEGGLRYTETTKNAAQGAVATDFTTNTPNPALEAPVAALGGASVYNLIFGDPHNFSGLSLKENHLQPELTLQYDLDRNAMLYAKAVRGAKAGGFDWIYAGELTNGPKSVHFLPEIATSEEVGFRDQLFDKKLSLAITAFHETVKDAQVSVFDGSTNFVVGNADTRSEGIEANLMYRPWQPVTFEATGSYDDSIYTRFDGAACTQAQTIAFIASPADPTCTQNLTGKITQFNPKYSYDLRVTHRVPVHSYVVTSQLNWNFRGPDNISDSDDPLLLSKGVGLLDMSIGIGPQDGRWQFSIFGKNLTDKLWATDGTSVPDVPGANFTDTQRPLQVGIRFHVSLGGKS